MPTPDAVTILRTQITGKIDRTLKRTRFVLPAAEPVAYRLPDVGCAHSFRGAPETCSQCAGAEARRVGNTAVVSPDDEARVELAIRRTVRRAKLRSDR